MISFLSYYIQFEIAHHVLLFGRQLVPTGRLPSSLNFHSVQAISHFGVEPVGRSDEVAELLASGSATSLPPWLLLRLFLLLFSNLSMRIPVCIDVSDQPRCSLVLFLVKRKI